MSVRTYSGSTLLPSFGCSSTTASSAECPKILVLRSRSLRLDSGATLGLLGALSRRWVQDVTTTGASKQIANADALMWASGPGNESQPCWNGFIGLGRDRPRVVPCGKEGEPMEYRGGVEQRQMVQAICGPVTGERGDHQVAKRRYPSQEEGTVAQPPGIASKRQRANQDARELSRHEQPSNGCREDDCPHRGEIGR